MMSYCLKCLLVVTVFASLAETRFFDIDTALDSIYNEERMTKKESKDYILECTQRPLELGLVIDASRSIRARNFSIGMRFVQDLMDRYVIGKGKVRVAAVTFGDKAYAEEAFGLAEHTNKAELKDALEKMTYFSAGMTETGAGINYMRTKQLANFKTRPGVPRVAIVLTDGNSQRRTFTQQMAKLARDDGIQMYAIGVGYSVKPQELLNIAGNKSRVYRVDNYSGLQDIQEELALQTCNKKPRPTTPPMAQPCGKEDPADINFVFDQASLGPDTLSWVTQFISHTADSEDMGKGMKLGTVSAICPDDAGFPLDTYNKITKLKGRLHEYGSPKRISKLTEQMYSSGFLGENGHRGGARKVGVIFLSGKFDEKALMEQVARARKDNIQIFFANTGGVPSGILSELEKYGKVLPGITNRDQSTQLVNFLCP